MTPALIIDIETAPRDPDYLRARGFTTPPRSYRSIGIHEMPNEHWQAWHDETAQLDPARSYICAVGLLNPAGAGKGTLVFTDEEGFSAERNLLIQLLELLEGRNDDLGEIDEKTRLVGHNIIDFDIPFILMRAMLNLEGPASTRLHERLLPGIRFPKLGRYLDTKVAWQDRFKGLRANSSSLDSIAATMGWPIKPGNGKDFYTWDRAKREEYLLHDLTTTGALARDLFPADKLGWSEVTADLEAPASSNV
jgi:hypothetical protein